jgi:hypothetical protein
MRFAAGQHVLLSSAQQRVEKEATIVEFEGDSLILALGAEGDAFVAGHAVRAHFVPHEYVATGVVGSIERSPSFALLHINGLNWKGRKPRAVRRTQTLNVTIDYLTAKDVRRTVGRTSDVSSTGARVRLRSALEVGTVAHLVIRVSADEVIEALGRVVRIVNGSEGGKGGYDVGFRFERIVAGKELLMLNEEQSTDVKESGSTVGTQAGEDDWFSVGEAA